MHAIARRLAALTALRGPLLLTFIGVVLLSLGVAYVFIHLYRTIEGLPGWVYYLTGQFMPHAWRGMLLVSLGLGTLIAGIWSLSGLVVIPLSRDGASPDGELVLGYKRSPQRPRITVLSGGAGMLVLANLGEQVERLTCVVPVQDPVEYYYRASGLFNFQHVYYVVPTPAPLQVRAALDDGTDLDIRQVAITNASARQHIERLYLAHNGVDPAQAQLTRLAAEAIRDADAIVLGPGSLFESILPNFLIASFRTAVLQSPARKIYICNLMTEPGRTTGFRVADHIRAIKHYAGFTPDYVLVNAQRIEPEITRLYEAANQAPVYLDLDDYEETTLNTFDQLGQRRLMVEGSVVIEADLAAAVIQYTASLANPTESRAVRVLRHDGQKLTATILELIRRM
jgi:2-phospho-L-lactate transferase/gluconeogenesis factor (CofD/UPF0052 family)